MSRIDIITTIGKKYLTSNIENEEFSYGKALKSIGKDYTEYLSEDAKRIYKKAKYTKWFRICDTNRQTS